MENEGQEIEDLLANHEAQQKRKKKINSGDKGKNNERKVCKIFSERFGLPFERSIGSGNRISQTKGISESGKMVLLGDISVPDDFLWVLEVKSGYEPKVDLWNAFVGGSSQVDDFLAQVTLDSERCSRKPMLLYKRNLRPWICAIRSEHLPKKSVFDYKFVYRDWTMVALESLLALPNPFFFKVD